MLPPYTRSPRKLFLANQLSTLLIEAFVHSGSVWTRREKYHLAKRLWQESTKAYLIRKALTRATKRKTNTLEIKNPQSSGHPSKPHFGSSFGMPFNQRMFFDSLNWNWGSSSSLDSETNDPTCCIVIVDSFTNCMEKTEKLPSALPFSSMRTWAGERRPRLFFCHAFQWMKPNLKALSRCIHIVENIFLH